MFPAAPSTLEHALCDTGRAAQGSRSNADVPPVRLGLNYAATAPESTMNT